MEKQNFAVIEGEKMKSLILISAILLAVPVAKAGNGSNGIPERVTALEEIVLQQQSQIDQNSEDSRMKRLLHGTSPLPKLNHVEFGNLIRRQKR